MDREEFREKYDEAEKLMAQGKTLDEVLSLQSTEPTTPPEAGTEDAEKPEAKRAAESGEADPSTTGEEPPADTENAEIERLRADNARLGKIAADNHRFATQKSQETAAVKKQLKEALDKAAPKPAVLDEVEGFEEGVEHVFRKMRDSSEEAETAGTEETKPVPEPDVYANWQAGVIETHPDFAELSKNPEFRARIQRVLDTQGSLPEFTVQEVSRYKSEVAGKQMADDKARKLKLAAMKVPTGGKGTPPGSKSTKSEEDEIRKIESMTLEEIREMSQRVVMHGG
jgi:hypothetical protein